MYLKHDKVNIANGHLCFYIHWHKATCMPVHLLAVGLQIHKDIPEQVT